MPFLHAASWRNGEGNIHTHTHTHTLPPPPKGEKATNVAFCSEMVTDCNSKQALTPAQRCSEETVGNEAGTLEALSMGNSRQTLRKKLCCPDESDWPFLPHLGVHSGPFDPATL